MPQNIAVAEEQFRRYEYCRDRGHLDFVHKAHKCDNFFLGNQWPEEDLKALELARRPAMTINKVMATIGTILGEQINNRTEVIFRPKNDAPAGVAEALSKVWMQISQNNQLPWVRSDVFADGLIRSRGFYDVRMCFKDSVFGEVGIAPINSKNVVIDPDAEEYDPDHWNDVYTTKWMAPLDIAVLYNESDADHLRARGEQVTFGKDAMDSFRDSFAADQKDLYRAGERADTERMLRVLDRQYRKLDKQLHFVDVATGDMRPVPAGWERDRIAVKKLVKRIRWTVTADDVVLHDDWSPYKHFTVVPYFPYFRYGKTSGVVEHLLGPQEVLNKVSSQELHIVNTTANSGYIVEEDSLANMTVSELEVHGAKTGLVIEYRKGAQPPAKIQPNQPPSGLDRISMKAEEHIKTISNVSDSMLGFDRADVAAKAIAYKQQRGSVSLGKVLDSLERTDFILARNVLDLVQQYYQDERILNITHEDFTREAEQVTVNKVDPVTATITNDLTIGEYDIVITSSPYRASLEDSQFEQARALREIGVPIPDSVLIENSRLLRRAEIVKQMSGDQESPQAKKQQELQMRDAEATVAEKEERVRKTQADTDLQLARTQKELEGEPGQQEENALEVAKMEREMALERFKVEQGMELERYKIEQEMVLKKWQAEQEMEIKRETAKMQAAQQRATQIAQQNSQPAVQQ